MSPHHVKITNQFLMSNFVQLENYQKPVNNDTHGYNGPIAISNGGTITPLGQDFLRASDSLGIPFSGMSSMIPILFRQ
jgi:alcohol oxidase